MTPPWGCDSCQPPWLSSQQAGHVKR
jgi:hypothetical protein